MFQDARELALLAELAGDRPLREVLPPSAVLPGEGGAAMHGTPMARCVEYDEPHLARTDTIALVLRSPPLVSQGRSSGQSCAL